MAHVDGTLIPGLDAKAFPIFDLQGNAVLAATLLSLPNPREGGNSKSALQLQATCKEISQALGAPHMLQ
jgi:DNA-binding IclR family transcriptional regulator